MIGFKWHIVTASLLLCLPFGGFSQSEDSLGISNTLPQADTVQLPHQEAIDSLQKAALHVHDSLRHVYDSVTGTAEIAVQRTRKQIDSVAALGLPADSFITRLDSIERWRNARLDSIANKIAALRANMRKELNGFDLPPEVARQVDAVLSRTNEPDLSLPDDIGINVPSLEHPVSGQSLPNIPDTNLSTENIGDLADPLAPIGPDAPTLSGQLPVQQQVAGVVPADTESAAVMLEEKAAALPATAGVAQQLDEASALNPMPATPEDPEAMKEKLVEDGKKMAVNHFAGKEAQLRQAMDKLSTLKKKYGSFESVANLPKKAPNPMREKPFVERLVPGVALQPGHSDHWLLDVNLYVGYRFTGRFTAGAGWNHRFAYDADANAFSSGPVIYGPRVYGEYDIGKGFSPRLELEYMNTYVPAQFASNPDNPDSREWVFGTMAGMKKEYTITRRLKGTVLLLYNVYDPHHKSPYKNRLNGRFGVEWGMKDQSNSN